MKINRKTVIAFGVALIVIPHLCNALDAEGNEIVKDIKAAYMKEDFIHLEMFSHSQIHPEKYEETEQMKKWKVALAKVRSYVEKNSTMVGVADKDLAGILTNVMIANARLIAIIESVNTESGVNYQNRTRMNPDLTISYKNKMVAYLEQLKDIRMNLDTAMAQLISVKFYVSSKGNAQEVLHTAIEYTQKAVTDVIKALIK